jgi:phosphocarrier protein HPr
MKNGTATDQAVTGAIVIAHEVGLHARPSVKLTKLAKTFTSKIELGLSEDGPWIDAKSIVKVMAFKAAKGTTLHFRAHGGDARAAIAAMVELVRRDFDERHGDG